MKRSCFPFLFKLTPPSEAIQTAQHTQSIMLPPSQHMTICQQEVELIHKYLLWTFLFSVVDEEAPAAGVGDRPLNTSIQLCADSCWTGLVGGMPILAFANFCCVNTPTRAEFSTQCNVTHHSIGWRCVPSTPVSPCKWASALHCFASPRIPAGGGRHGLPWASGMQSAETTLLKV